MRIDYMREAVVIPVYSLAYFTPTIVKTLGFSVVQTQLHSVTQYRHSQRHLRYVF